MTTTPLPWRATPDGDVYDGDGQIVCTTAPDDAARIVAAVNGEARMHEKMSLLAALDARVAAFEDATKRLVLAFDVGDLAHTTLNGRGYAALARLRALLVEVNDDRA